MKLERDEEMDRAALEVRQRPQPILSPRMPQGPEREAQFQREQQERLDFRTIAAKETGKQVLAKALLEALESVDEVIPRHEQVILKSLINAYVNAYRVSDQIKAMDQIGQRFAMWSQKVITEGSKKEELIHALETMVDSMRHRQRLTTTDITR